MSEHRSLAKCMKIIRMRNGMITAIRRVASDAEARIQTASPAPQIGRAEPRFYQDQPQPELTSRRCALPGSLWEASDWPFIRKATDRGFSVFQPAPANTTVTP